MLYVHIPFCSTRCHYCAFFSSTDTTKMHMYREVLLQEIYHGDSIHGIPLEEPVTSIFIGGGTPSLYSASVISEILEAIYATYTIDTDIEITLECNPESVSYEKASIWRAAGINRISLGCQSFDNATLLVLGRKHAVSDIYRAIDALYKAAVDTISIDLIFAHAGQTVSSWLKELSTAITLPIQHISCYGLTVEENTTLAQWYTTKETIAEDTFQELYEKGRDFLKEHGFEHYEISNYARGEERYCRHNCGYWCGEIYYGFGASAASYTGNKRYQHSADITQWVTDVTQSIEHRSTIAVPYENIDSTLRRYEQILLGLRTKRGVSLQVFASECTNNGVLCSTLRELEEAKLCYTEAGYYKCTDAGEVVLDSIIAYIVDTL